MFVQSQFSLEVASPQIFQLLLHDLQLPLLDLLGQPLNLKKGNGIFLACQILQKYIMAHDERANQSSKNCSQQVILWCFINKLLHFVEFSKRSEFFHPNLDSYPNISKFFFYANKYCVLYMFYACQLSINSFKCTPHVKGKIHIGPLKLYLPYTNGLVVHVT